MAKKKNLRSFVSSRYIILLVVFIVMVISAVMFALAFFLFDGLLKNIFELVFGSIYIVSVVSILFLYIFFSEKTFRVFYDTLYKKNMENLTSIKEHRNETAPIEDDSIEEFKEINQIYDEINNQNKGKVVTSSDGDINNIPLEYIDEDHTIVTYDSLINNIVNLIIVNKSYRNALVDISYEMGSDKLDEKEQNRVLGVLKKSISYKNTLIAKQENGLVIYIPVFDSVSQLEEELSSMFRHISVARRTSEGKMLTPAKIAAVIYPYSAPDKMVSDLALAKRSDKPLYIYLPSQGNKVNKTPLYENFNINELAKVSERLDLLDIDDSSSEKEINRALNDICNYFSFTMVGFVKLNKVKKQYLCEHAYSPDNRNLIPLEKQLSFKFVNKLVEVKDADQSYYFSSRQHLNDALAPFIDSHDIKSGLFYMVMRDNVCEEVIYFLNDDKDLEFDISIKQGLINISNKIGNYLKSFDEHHIAKINARRFQEILKLNNDVLYSVNPDDYTLFFVSPALKSLAPNVEVGQKCHKALYDNDLPCKECPLKTKKHMVEIFKRRKFETSVVLHNDEDKAEHLLLTPMERNKTTSDLFSPEFLINTYYSLCSYLEDEFVMEHEGEIIFLSIDNVPQLVKSFGNDGYIKAIRNFFDDIKENIDMNLTPYLYKNDKFALLFPSSEREEVINLVEQIYVISKEVQIGNKPASINISYYDFKYPDANKDHKSFVNHAEKVMTGIRRGNKTDMLYFNEDKYVRSASREAFMLNNVLEAFGKKKYYMEYQPIVGNKDRTIHGVELLLRLNDPFTDQPINIGEAINIVMKNNRIDLVSRAVEDCLDQMFMMTDLSFFKSVGLEHLSINVDYKTITDESFIDSIADLAKKHSIPKDFICYEIPEYDILDHYNEFRELKVENAVLVCDQYRGELLRLDQLKELGFKEVKMSREVILNIIKDDMALTRAIDTWKSADQNGMQVTFVGVEKRQQADLLHDDVLDSGFQGRFFYSPMKEEQFLKVLRENSIKEIADLDN